MSSCPLQGHGESGNHQSQQTDRRTENQTPHVLTPKWMVNNENTWTQGGEHQTLGPVGGRGRDGGGKQQVGELGRDNIRRNT